MISDNGSSTDSKHPEIARSL